MSKLVLLQVEHPLGVDDVVDWLLFLHHHEGIRIQETKDLPRHRIAPDRGLPRDHRPRIARERLHIIHLVVQQF